MVTKVCIAFVTLTSECALAQSKHLPLFSWKDRAHAQALGQIGGAIAGPLLRVAALFLLVSPAMCHAQNLCLPVIPVTSSTPSPWYVGQTIYAVFPNLAGTDATNYNFALVTANGNEVPLDSLTNCGWNSEVGFPFVIDPAVPTETATAQYWLTCDPVSGPCSPPEGSTWLQASFPVQIVGCPTPAIASVLPSTWFAGKSYDKVTITGTGFTTEGKATAACPVTPVTITAADGSAVPISAVTVENKTTITLTGVAPPAADRTETATVTAGTAPNTGTFNTAQILGNQIMCGLATMNCTQPVISTTDGSDPPVQSVVVGQPIHLTTQPLPAGITATSTTWKVSGTSIGGYAPTTASATITPTTLKNASLNTYWVYPLDSIPVTYIYCVNISGVGNQCSQEAKAAFNVSGPSATITANPTYWSVSPPMACPSIVQLLYFGYPDPTSGCSHKPLVKGISFTAALSNVPNGGGTAEWVQLVKGNRLSGTTLSGVPATPTSLGVGLDKSYPYPPDDPNDPVTTEASDSPNNGLDTSLARETRRFKADMYYLWTSEIDPASIPVPLGYIEWSSSGTAAQHTKNSPPWSLTLSEPTSAVFKVSSDTGSTHGLPTWSGMATQSQSDAGQLDEEDELEEQQ